MKDPKRQRPPAPVTTTPKAMMIPTGIEAILSPKSDCHSRTTMTTEDMYDERRSLRREWIRFMDSLDSEDDETDIGSDVFSGLTPRYAPSDEHTEIKTPRSTSIMGDVELCYPNVTSTNTSVLFSKRMAISEDEEDNDLIFGNYRSVPSDEQTEPRSPQQMHRQQLHSKLAGVNEDRDSPTPNDNDDDEVLDMFRSLKEQVDTLDEILEKFSDLPSSFSGDTDEANKELIELEYVPIVGKTAPEEQKQTVSPEKLPIQDSLYKENESDTFEEEWEALNKLENELRQELSTVSLELDTQNYPSEPTINETGEATDTNSDASKGVTQKETRGNISNHITVDIQEVVPEKESFDEEYKKSIIEAMVASINIKPNSQDDSKAPETSNTAEAADQVKSSNDDTTSKEKANDCKIDETSEEKTQSKAIIDATTFEEKPKSKLNKQQTIYSDMDVNSIELDEAEEIIDSPRSRALTRSFEEPSASDMIIDYFWNTSCTPRAFKSCVDQEQDDWDTIAFQIPESRSSDMSLSQPDSILEPEKNLSPISEKSCDGDDEQGDSSKPSSDPDAGYSSAYRFDAAQLGAYAKETTQAVPSEEVLSPQHCEEDGSAKCTSPQPQKTTVAVETYPQPVSYTVRVPTFASLSSQEEPNEITKHVPIIQNSESMPLQLNESRTSNLLQLNESRTSNLHLAPTSSSTLTPDTTTDPTSMCKINDSHATMLNDILSEKSETDYESSKTSQQRILQDILSENDTLPSHGKDPSIHSRSIRFSLDANDAVNDETGTTPDTEVKEPMTPPTTSEKVTPFFSPNLSFELNAMSPETMDLMTVSAEDDDSNKFVTFNEVFEGSQQKSTNIKHVNTEACDVSVSPLVTPVSSRESSGNEASIDHVIGRIYARAKTGGNLAVSPRECSGNEASIDDVIGRIYARAKTGGNLDEGIELARITTRAIKDDPVQFKNTVLEEFQPTGIESGVQGWTEEGVEAVVAEDLFTPKTSNMCCSPHIEESERKDRTQPNSPEQEGYKVYREEAVSTGIEMILAQETKACCPSDTVINLLSDVCCEPTSPSEGVKVISGEENIEVVHFGDGAEKDIAEENANTKGEDIIQEKDTAEEDVNTKGEDVIQDSDKAENDMTEDYAKTKAEEKIETSKVDAIESFREKQENDDAIYHSKEKENRLALEHKRLTVNQSLLDADDDDDEEEEESIEETMLSLNQNLIASIASRDYNSFADLTTKDITGINLQGQVSCGQKSHWEAPLQPRVPNDSTHQFAMEGMSIQQLSSDVVVMMYTLVRKWKYESIEVSRDTRIWTKAISGGQWRNSHFHRSKVQVMRATI